MKVTVLEKNGEYAAAVFTENGLYRTALPRPSEKEAIIGVAGEGLERSTKQEHIEVLKAVFAVADGRTDIDLSKIRFDFSGMTKKQKLVAKEAAKIPRGKTISYGELAEKAGLPGAARFVGNVMANNRHGPLIPCHRVVASQGLGGYGGGLEKKIELLTREGAFAD